MFARNYQPKLTQLFQKGRTEPLDFGLGYQWRVLGSNLLLATRLEAPEPETEAIASQGADVAPTDGADQAAAKKAASKSKSQKSRTAAPRPAPFDFPFFFGREIKSSGVANLPRGPIGCLIIAPALLKEARHASPLLRAPISSAFGDQPASGAKKDPKRPHKRAA